MPRTRSLAFSELKIGILAVAALAIASMVIFMLSGQGGFFWQRYSLKTRFPEVAGAQNGRAGARRGDGGGQRDRHRLRRAGGGGRLRGVEGGPASNHHRVGRGARIAEPPRPGYRGRHALGGGRARPGVGLREERPHSRAVVGRRRGGQRGARGGHAAAAGDPGREGNGRPTVHRRPPLRRNPGLRPRVGTGGPLPPAGPRDHRQAGPGPRASTASCRARSRTSTRCWPGSTLGRGASAG